MQSGSKITLIIVLVAVGGVLGLKLARPKPTSPAGGQSAADLSPARRALAEAQEQRQPVLVCIHSTTCKACKRMKALLAEIEPEFEGQVRFLLVQEDDPREQSLVEEYQVKIIPRTLLLDRDGKPVAEKTGAWPKEELVAELKQLTGE